MNRPLTILGTICLLISYSSAAEPAPSALVAPDNEEAARIYAEDQGDRQPKNGAINWAKVGPRDEARLKRIREMYAAGELKTGKDWYHAGMVLQHGHRPEDYLLCHELCIAAVFQAGSSDRSSWVAEAKWLAAASEDRFLASVGRAQRFGTQFTKTGDEPWRLNTVEEGVTDELRIAWNVPTLQRAREREAELNRMEKAQKPNQSPEPTAMSVTPPAAQEPRQP